MVRRPRIILYPYKMASESVKLLAQELRSRGRKVMRVRQNGQYVPRVSDLIVNWGACAENGMWPNWHGFGDNRTLNYASAVACARNKLDTFNWLKEHSDVSIPSFTTDVQIAKDWTGTVLCRDSLTGSKGQGINIADEQVLKDKMFVEMFDGYPLYVQYIKKKSEFRIHVFNELAIFAQQKKKKLDWEGERDTKIRNLANGYVFCHDNITVPVEVVNEGVKAVKALGLHFGAADVIWNEHHQKAYVLEVNTAPGLEGQTVIEYANAIEEEFKRRNP